MVGHAPAERSQRFDEQRERLRSRYLKAEDARPPSSGRGLHHAALVSSDVERTIRFYQDQLEFPLTELFENRDYPGSSHFFFDIGNGNLLGFFDFPNLDLGTRRCSAACITSQLASSRSNGTACAPS